MRHWRKSAIEFCIISINTFNIKSLGVVAFNEYMENIWRTESGSYFIIYAIDAQFLLSYS